MLEKIKPTTNWQLNLQEADLHNTYISYISIERNGVEICRVAKRVGETNAGLRERAKELLDTLTKYSDWLPISTALKDGTEILAKNKDGIQRVVKWDDISMSGEKGWQVAVIATDFNYYEELEDVISWKPLE